MTGPTPEQSQAILSAAGERYVRGGPPFDLRLLIIDEAWQAAQADERERVREQVEACEWIPAFVEETGDYRPVVFRSDVLDVLREPSEEEA